MKDESRQDENHVYFHPLASFITPALSYELKYFYSL